MEIIEKQISLEPFKSRHPSLIPFLDENMVLVGLDVLSVNGNWGNFPCDIDITKCKGYENLASYFNGNRVSFRQILDKYNIFEEILTNSFYYRKISKKGNFKWITYEPTLSEKYTLPIFPSLNDKTVGENTLVGLYRDNSFEENGGLLMLSFLLKALGKFIVDRSYVKDDNYVPEILYYCGIVPFMEMMKRLKNDNKCCGISDYELYGGDKFYQYLVLKKGEIKDECNFWLNALYRDSDRNVKISSFNVAVALNGEMRNMGLYTVCNDDTYDKITDHEVEYETESMLKYLRMDKLCYCDNNGVEEELPVALVTCDDETAKYEMLPKYCPNRPKNVTVNVSDDGTITYVGDIIYNMVYNDDMTEVTIDYVISGKLKSEDGQWVYDVESNTGLRFSEVRACEIHDYTKDKNRQLLELIGEIEMDILKNPNIIKNVNNAIIISDENMNAEVMAKYNSTQIESITNAPIIMYDYDFGKFESLVENVEDVMINRGFTSAFEMHYKLGEINTFDDLAKYGNDSFNIGK